MARFRIPTAAVCALVIAISALFTGTTAATADPGASPYGVPAPSTLNLDYEEQIVDVFNSVNKFRIDKGLAPLTFNVTVSEMAEDWTDIIAGEKRMTHNSTMGSDPRVVDRWNVAGENLAARWDGSGEEIVNQWIDSPSHNANMSSPKFTTMGIGIHITGNLNSRSDPKNYYMWSTLNLFDFHIPPAGTYANAQDYFDGLPPLDNSDTYAVRAEAPIWNDETNEYTIPEVKGIDYLVYKKATRPGTYRMGAGSIFVQAIAQSGYKVLGQSIWSHTFPNLLPVSPGSVTFTDIDGSDSDTYTVPSVQGVRYVVQGTTILPGTYGGSGTVAVTAEAEAGYILVPGSTTTWTRTFLGADPIQVTPATVVFSDLDGTADDVYTVPEVKGVVYLQGNRILSAGTYAGSGTVTVTANAIEGYALAPGAIASWTGTFTDKPAPYAPPARSPFADVSTQQQFYKEMAWLADQGISTGWTEADGSLTYRPLQSINRDAMAAFLYRAAGSPAYKAPARSPFADVSTQQQFYKEMAWLADQGISTGWTEVDGSLSYRPLQSINRDAMAAFLYRYTVNSKLY